MRLTDEEKRILDGQQGEPLQKAMEMLAALGEIYGAEKTVPIKSAHLAGLSLKSHGIAGAEWAEDTAKAGARVSVPTTMNVVGVDRSRDLKLPADWCRNQLRIEDAYECMGCYGTSTCVPYYIGFVPRFGEHIAWAESSAVVFTNSVLGARDNREGGPSATAAGMVGRTPLYGMHLDENRRGDILFKVTAKLEDISDYGALGAYVGRIVGTKIPVFDGLVTPSIEDLVYLGAALASSGSVAMFHAVGVTPEAPSVAAAFGGKKYDTVLITDKEIAAGKRQLTSATDRKVDYVAIGCPHFSLKQVKETAMLLQGRKVSQDVVLWIHTNVAIKALATQLGYTKIIEDAGGVLTQDLCTVLSIPEALGFKTLATSSPKMAFYAPGGNGLMTWYGSVKQCIDAAVKGYWE
ncbi:MAG: aconitase X catalytic domain-containing protein [Negativicutes bacterium]|nr:aconitase X catalytic domain-containing protein [Negativicutes bacterium]